jgi:HD-GYP domain-containing protein (c-di-GMP phosphodiesterase class II)
MIDASPIETPSLLSSSPSSPQAEQVTRALVDSIALKDRYTGGHVKRVGHYAVRVARQVSLLRVQSGEPALTDDELARIHRAALLHDLGKLFVAEDILTKTAPLDPQEREVMQAHPEVEAGMERELLAVPGLEDAVWAMKFHHERWDGQGYPQGLGGEQIPWVARIVAVADAYDAMVSTRPYRQGIGQKAAREEIQRGSGTQFDPRVVQAFLQAFSID